jgi:succinate dehydrogenase / fumarate reductase membrane anchor subunit
MSRAAHGLRAWILQRVTAVYLALFTLYALYRLGTEGFNSHAEWAAWLQQPAVAIAWALFVLSVLLHAWVGVRDILIDYVHPVVMRLTLMAGVVFVLAGCGLWALRALLWPAVVP